MSGRPTVSVIIPSRGRPHLVPVVLSALTHLTYPAFEVILVGDAPDLDAYELPDEIAHAVHYAPCPAENISAARNIGIRAARGEVVAFLDDDSVPEPDWLTHLAEAFADPRVGIAGGPVRDRDGVRYQFRGARISLLGEEEPLGPTRAQIQVLPPDEQPFPAIMGTNCAFRREGLMAIGGFDESFIYYLDETDAALRMGQDGWFTGWVPMAEVHHASGENAVRGRNRQPRDPFQLGASKAYFGQRHVPEAQRDQALSLFRDRIEREIDTHIRIGHVSGSERSYLLARLEQGFQAGVARRPVLPLAVAQFERLILPYGPRLPEARLSLAVLSGPRLAQTFEMQSLARALAARGHRVSFFDTRAPSQPHQAHFADGIWVHEGFEEGKLDLYRFLMRRPRPIVEVMRVAEQRRFDGVIRPFSWDHVVDRENWVPLRTGVAERGLRCRVLRKTGDPDALISTIRDEVIAALLRDPPPKVSIPAPPRSTRPGPRSATVSSR